MKVRYNFFRKLEPCGVRTCQDEVTTSSVCTAVTKKTQHRTENTKTTTMWPEEITN